MSDYFAIRVVDGQHAVGVTTDGIDWIPLPRAAFGSPRDAIRYADMRQARVSPLRAMPDVSPSSDIARSGSAPERGLGGT